VIDGILELRWHLFGAREQQLLVFRVGLLPQLEFHRLHLGRRLRHERTHGAGIGIALLVADVAQILDDVIHRSERLRIRAGLLQLLAELLHVTGDLIRRVANLT